MSQTVLLSGAAGGIGILLVEELLKQNCKVIAVSRTINKFDALKMKYGEALSIIEVDFLQHDFLEVLDEKLAGIDQIDILINNAGLLINKPFEDVQINEIHDLVTVNYTAALALTQKSLPKLKKSGQAHVVNISTMGAVQGSVKFPGLSIYASTKAAICTFTEVMAEEYKNDGIHFNCLALGSVDTNMFNDAFPGQQASVSAKEMAHFITDFSLSKRELFNGKIIPVAVQTP